MAAARRGSIVARTSASMHGWRAETGERPHQCAAIFTDGKRPGRSGSRPLAPPPSGYPSASSRHSRSISLLVDESARRRSCASGALRERIRVSRAVKPAAVRRKKARWESYMR